MWRIRKIDELAAREWYDITKLRVDTFVVEQQCAYPEIDEQDLSALHITRFGNGLEAYARIIEDKDIYIGRVIVNQSFRQRGLARELMTVCLDYIDEHYPGQCVKLQAQAHLTDFYRTFGFKEISVTYFEDMIPHVDMERSNETNL
ncbi:GNAT family N-acetyltransferase [Macrococcus brunensis]|uniref:GNAT family N-acetyltransferase n=1 Tax=Macrococcus brunensis TaxID=198483 RepID=A0A4R6BGJ8_9STAP|nr:GNAT family N-acetyltransferase [Macrococcus brunensis]TDL99041.1 GNAT family N-acetyltransferase [Macrococcus brunensis]